MLWGIKANGMVPFSDELQARVAGKAREERERGPRQSQRMYPVS